MVGAGGKEVWKSNRSRSLPTKSEGLDNRLGSRAGDGLGISYQH
jgi:hypothetical protein